MTEIERLIKKRGSVKAKVTIFTNFILECEKDYPNKIITDEIVVSELQFRIERFQTVLNEYEEIQLQIDELADNAEAQLSEREKFERDFHAVYAKAKRFLNESIPDDRNSDTSSNKSNGSVRSNRVVNRGNVSSLKLPAIEIPTYNGNYESWLEFRDTYDSLIHKNSALSNIQKYHYLRAFLGPRVLEIIASLEFCESNYESAWELICNRFNNSRILIQNHVKSLFNLNKICEESSKALREMIDSIAKHLRALNALKEPTDSWDTLIIYLVTTKLDDMTLRKWEQEKAAFDKPTLENMKKFLKERADLLESLEQSKVDNKFKDKRYSPRNSKHSSFKQPVYKSFLTSNVSCSYCKKEHYIQNCPDFEKLCVKERNEAAMKKRLCFNCLRPGHMTRKCYSKCCKTCHERHNTLLHPGKVEHSKTEQNDENNRDVEQESVNLSSRVSTQNQVLLATVSVQVYDKNNKPIVARALLDAGSQSSFLTEEFCNKLQVSCTPINLQVSGLNETQSNVKSKTTVQVQSMINNFSLKTSCLVVPSITSNLPNFKIDKNSLQIPENIKLADEHFYMPGKIDLLLGGDYFWEIMCVGQIKLNEHGPFLQKTKFGWIVSGKIEASSAQTVQCNLLKNIDVDKQLIRFWEIEELSPSRLLSKEEKMCEDHFIETFTRDENGQFVVTIPLKDTLEKLGDSYQTAEKRLLTLERKFERDEVFKTKYSSFIKEYQDLGHMSKVNEPDNALHTYYMPHHGVIKESSLTTKLRVVFDASCPSSSGYSFNELQLVGPTIQPDLFTHLLRYRKYNFVIGADVEKMYRMCKVTESQRALQRILWRENTDEPINKYDLNTVTYGTASAAYLAIRCLYQLGIECESEFPIESNVIKNHFYVDDMLSGANSVEEAISIANNVSKILSLAGFHLRKWVSNSSLVLEGIETSDKADIIDLGVNENTKTLGIVWNGQKDCFSYNIGKSSSKNITKRTVLSEISQVFDPLGLLSCCTILAKIILRDIWLEKLEWDDSLSQILHTRWLQLRDDLHVLNSLQIPRQVMCKNATRVELHGFCDASTRAYGACVYLKSISQNGETFIRLICAKSKVAPLKIQTIPRLELTSALLLARLVDKVKTSLETPIEQIVFWTDSTIVLGWLHTTPNLLQVFVANRVSAIQELSDIESWRHVSTFDNPADHVSRGVTPVNLLTLDIYWSGPNWLKYNEESWPERHNIEKDLPELKKNIVFLEISIDKPVIEFEKYSSLTKLERIVAYCIRFINNCRKPKIERDTRALSLKEINHASLCLIKLVQQQSFHTDILSLRNSNEIDCKSKLTKLNPFLDKNEVLRVGGRLANSDFYYDKKYPILLCSKHRFTKLLFTREHIRLLHAGPQLLLGSIREQYWPLAGRNLARKTFRECVRCFRVNPKSIHPIMGNLPGKRLSPAPPFSTTGVDYAGPF